MYENMQILSNLENLSETPFTKTPKMLIVGQVTTLDQS